ncbi:Thioesterase superfamily protein [Theileria parva strain Muguga]|uniref:Thioesterase domain-containing protein n=1 Tax=Theileria parva TaxID=5875 RepID=Q4N0P4_THEPA|nr:Thioesterase superfamily protein [Theileria parva strain Muguga]EAN30808.1 Thioesterase superfamily protein [Theileria parva strain Muguga]|eukprot:XP_763091.1 hypothetical protein [Theileria parva strain Muguga]
MVKIPEWCHKYFKYRSYSELELFSLSKLTQNKYGHLFNDLLMRDEGFTKRMFINTSSEVMENGTGPAMEECDTLKREEVLKMLSKEQSRKSKVHLLTVVNVGNNACGHAGVWHGGVISAIFDNLFGLMGNVVLPLAATKSLTINFKSPVSVGTTVVAVTEHDPETSKDADRFTVSGSMFDESGKLVATGSSELVDVSKRWAK